MSLTLSNIIQTAANRANGPSVTATLASAPTEGRTLIALVNKGVTEREITPPSGLTWTQQFVYGDTDQRTVECWTAAVSASAPSSYTFAYAGSPGNLVILLLEVSNFGGIVNHGGASAGPATNLSVPTSPLSGVTVGNLLISPLFTYWGTGTGYSVPSGYTLIQEFDHVSSATRVATTTSEGPITHNWVTETTDAVSVLLEMQGAAQAGLPYSLTTHAEPHPNSPLVNAQFGTTGTVELGVVTDFNSAVATCDWAAIDAAGAWTDDITPYVTTISEGATTATLEYYVVETEATGTFDVELTVAAEQLAPQGVPVIGTITKDTSSGTIPFSYALSDADSFEHSINGGDTWETVASPIVRLSLSDGVTYGGQIRAVNSAGPGSAASYSFTTDEIVPEPEPEPEPEPPVDPGWIFGKFIKHAAPQTWEHGKRHPKTGMRTRMFK